MALVPQAECVGKGVDSPEEERREGAGEEWESQTEQHEIEEDEYREKRLPNTRIGKIAKTARSAKSFALSGNDARETLVNPQSNEEGDEKESLAKPSEIEGKAERPRNRRNNKLS